MRPPPVADFVLAVLLASLAFLGISTRGLLPPWPDPGAPVLEESARFDRPGLWPGGVMLHGGCVVAVGPEGLLVLRPTRGRMETLALLPEGRGHALAGAGPGEVLVADRRTLKLVDVRDPSRPEVRATLDDGPPGGFGGVASGDRALYAAAGSAGVYRVAPAGRRLEVVRVFGGAVDARAVAVDGQDLVVADGPGGLLVILPDGSTARLRLPGFARDVAVAINFAAVALEEGGLVVADLGVRHDPRLMARFDWAAPARAVAWVEPRLAVASGRHVGLLDFSVPEEPQLQAWLGLDAPVPAVSLAGESVLLGTPDGIRALRVDGGAARGPHVHAPPKVDKR